MTIYFQEHQLTEDEVNQLRELVHKSYVNGTKYPGMSYEQGIEAMLYIIDGDEDVADAL